MVLPTAEWISSTPRQASVSDAGAYGASSDSPPSSVSPQPAVGTAGTPTSSSESRQQHVDVHRGSGGLVRGRAVFCLPPDAVWFQGHFAYAARGGCTASLGVLGTELPVDPVSIYRTRTSGVFVVAPRTTLLCTEIYELLGIILIYRMVITLTDLPGTR